MTGVVTAGATLYTGFCAIHGLRAPKGTFGDNFWNCFSTPLSWAGLNPRDNLRLESLECPRDAKASNGEIKVHLKSKMGATQVRTIAFTGEKPTQVTAIEFGQDAKPGNRFDAKFKADGALERATVRGVYELEESAQVVEDPKPLREAQELFADARFYIGLCKEPARYSEVQESLRKDGVHGGPAPLERIPEPLRPKVR